MGVQREGMGGEGGLEKGMGGIEILREEEKGEKGVKGEYTHHEQ